MDSQREDVLAAAGFDLSAECEVCQGEGTIGTDNPSEPIAECPNCEGWGVIPVEGTMPS